MIQNFTLKKGLITLAFLPAFQLIAQVTMFSYTGAVQTYTVPAGVTNIQLETWGAQGGGSEDCSSSVEEDGGLGGYAIGNLAVTGGDVLTVVVGGKPSTTLAGASPGGYNGGGISGQYAGGGGGASDVRFGGTGLADRIIVAGGGGGGNTGCPNHGTGGIGGGLTGGDGIALGAWAMATGGTTMAGGIGAGGGSNGELGAGGTGLYHVAGGGGGYYGGGAAFGAGSGGGSSFYGGVLAGSTTGGIRAGNGEIVITVLCDPLTVTVSDLWICFGETVTFDASGVGDITWDGGLINGVPFVMDVAGSTTFTATSDNPGDCGFSIDVFVSNEIIITYVTTDEIIGGDGEIDATVTGGIGIYLFDWDNDGTGDFDDTEDLTGLVAGTYVLHVMDDSLCVNSSELTVNSQLSVNENKESIVSIYPNPTTNNVSIAYPGTFVYEVLNVDGKVIMNGSAVNNSILNMEALSTGTYLIRITANNKQELVKVVKM